MGSLLVYGAEDSASIDDYRMPLQSVLRPNNLQRVRGAYGLLIMVEYMSPVLRRGDIVFISPVDKPRPDEEVVLLHEDQACNTMRLRFGTLVTSDTEGWTLRSWQPEQTEYVERSLWQACHVVVGKLAR